MKREIPIWAIIRWSVVAAVYGLTILIARDLLSTKESAIKDQQGKIDEYRKNLGKSTKKLAEVTREKDDLDARFQKLSYDASNLMKSSKHLLNAHKELKSAEDVQRIIASATVDPVSKPKEMTDDEKLASYMTYGIEGIPKTISKPILDVAAQEKYAFSAVYEIERQAKGYLEFESFKKTPTRLPLNIKNAMIDRAMRERPGNWASMADELKNQVTGWNVIQGWYSTGVPGLTKQQSMSAIQEAMQVYPDNWEMQVSRVKVIADR
mgnify:CR=1 FL=1